MGFSKQLMSLNFFSDNDTLRGLIWVEVKVIFDSSPSEFHVKFNSHVMFVKYFLAGSCRLSLSLSA